MRKGIKISLMILSAILLLLIIFSALPAIIFSIPSVQNSLIDKVATRTTDYLGAKVSVGRITAGMFNRVVVRDFYVEDLDGDTLLFVKRADATFGPLKTLANRNLVLSSGKITGGKFVLRETDRGTINVKEITDQLVNRNQKSPFVLNIEEISGTGIEFRMHLKKDFGHDEGVDYANMCLNDIDVQLSDFQVNGSNVDSKIDALTFVERSGFRLKDFVGRFSVRFGKVRVYDTKMMTEKSTINLDNLLLDGEDWLKYKDFINNVPIICRVSDCCISTDDVGYFAPEMWRWNTTIYNTTASMNGPVADFKGMLDNLELENGGRLRGSAHVKGLIDVEKTHFDIKVDRLNASTNEIATLLSRIARLSVGNTASQYISRVERVDARGVFRGTIRRFKAKAYSRLASGGSVVVDCAMSNPARGNKKIQANLTANEVNLNTLLANKLFGNATFTASANAEIGKKGAPKLTASTDISSIEMYGYDYREISANAELQNNRLTGRASSHDRALRFNAKTAIDWSDKSKTTYKASVSVDRADLHALNINKRDSISILRGIFDLSARGASLDDMVGSLTITDAKYENRSEADAEKEYPWGRFEDEKAKKNTNRGLGCSDDNIVISVDRKGGKRNITLNSDFADAKFESNASYEDVIYYLQTLLLHYIPQLYDEATREKMRSHAAGLSDEDALISVKTKNINPLLDCVADGLEIADNSSAKMTMNPSKNRFSIRVKSDYLEHSNSLATNIDIKAGNAMDSLTMSVEAEDLYWGALHFSGVDFNGGIKNNRINVDAIFADTIQHIGGAISAEANISRKNNRRNIAIKFNPSSLTSGDTTWDITTDGIEIDSARIDVRRFAMRSDNQELFINGVASGREQDSLHMTMRNFSLSPLTQITSRIGYIVNARTNGYATVHSAFNDTRIDALIDVDSIDINGIDIPDVQLVSKWDFGQSRASLRILTSKDKKQVIEGFFKPSKLSYMAYMQADSVKMELLDPVLSGVITDTRGRANARVVLEGEKREANLFGNIHVDSLATTIAYTQCRYSAPKAEVRIENNHIIATDVDVFDQEKGKGKMSMDVSLAHLNNIVYNINITADNMKVLNTTARDNSMFYGSIFASGSGSVNGDKAGVKMEFAAKSDDNSKFYMPLTGASEVSNADFVTFVSRTQRDSLSYLMRKKMKFESRRRKGMSSSSAMDIALNLDILPNAEAQLVIDPVVGDLIKGTGKGNINMHINTQKDIFEMYGDYTIEKGSYLFTLQNIVNKWFDIEPGSTIQWTGDPLDAILNIDAVYKLKASLQPLLEGSMASSHRSTRAVPVECYIHLTDRLMQPTVTFDIAVPSADSDVQNFISSALATPESKSQQFLYLIIANSFISESSNSMSSSIGAAATAATGFEMLSNQFSNWLSSQDSKIVLRYRPRTAQMSDEFDFGFSKDLINNRLLIEVEGNYIVDKTQVVNGNSNFTGEAYLTWLLDRAGTLRLKGFTHTIDRFDENQGLQETGLGIYFKEDFENAKDLMQRMKSYFTRENRGSKKKNKNKEKEEKKAEKE